jgi:hypothetical protein
MNNDGRSSEKIRWVGVNGRAGVVACARAGRSKSAWPFEALWFVGTLAETRQRGSRGIEDLASRQDGRQRKKQWTSANFASSK